MEMHRGMGMGVGRGRDRGRGGLVGLISMDISAKKIRVYVSSKRSIKGGYYNSRSSSAHAVQLL